jgi:regulator of replication initiation timing
MADADSRVPQHENSAPTAISDMPPDTDRQTVVGEWLGPPEAEQRLGISERTLYRRIASGRLKKRALDDGRIEVWVSGPLTDADRHEHADENGQEPVIGGGATDGDRQATSERALALMDRFNAALARQVEPLVQELADTRRQLVALAEQTGRLSERTEHLIQAQEQLLIERDQLRARLHDLERQLTDSRMTDTDRQKRVIENGQLTIVPSTAADTDSQVTTTAETLQLRHTASQAATAPVEPSSGSVPRRPWWMFWRVSA